MLRPRVLCGHPVANEDCTRSTDGGESWTAILTKGPWTGVTDLAIDPRNPNMLYAATHQRHRTVWGVIDGGPESGIFKSTDAGASRGPELTNGLPDADKGKMSSPSHLSNPTFSTQPSSWRTAKGASGVPRTPVRGGRK